MSRILFHLIITFTTEGTRGLQTLTDQDTIIFLYGANRILLASDDDSGYDENGIEMCKSSITFTAQPNVPYLIIIRAEDLADFGEVTVFIDN